MVKSETVSEAPPVVQSARESTAANSLEDLVRPPRFERGTFSSEGRDGEESTTPDDTSE
jgi:hypothetical protein